MAFLRFYRGVGCGKLFDFGGVFGGFGGVLGLLWAWLGLGLGLACGGAWVLILWGLVRGLGLVQGLSISLDKKSSQKFLKH